MVMTYESIQCLDCRTSCQYCTSYTRRSLSFQHFSMLLLITSILSISYVDGRPISQEPKEEERMVGVALIGSRPPRCEGRCISCGHCEAVQVPIAPQSKLRKVFHGEILSRGDESSTNYKPLNWKCKCGDVIINP
ncbi:Epidermal patterning factor-like protein [Rhynchospora pubera]|uniref:Epidermal patterning factor-like protein n=1 Tax=Rhynchospora pubera TaxID=906938 RepID=A0AAV8FHH3_9POAL|nr:Epidermal patterning factor-like protein [Rhynchospora pubera]